MKKVYGLHYSTCSDVGLFRNFVAVWPAHEKALSDGAEEAGSKVCLHEKLNKRKIIFNKTAAAVLRVT